MKHLRVLLCVALVIALLLPPARGFTRGNLSDVAQVEPNTAPAAQGSNPRPDPNPPPPPPAAPIQLLAPAAVHTPPSLSPLGREVTLTVGSADSFALTVNTGDAAAGKSDVMFTFDLTGSMSEEISQTQASALTIAQSIRMLLPNSRFGVASFMDYPGTYTYTGYAQVYGVAPDVPWRLNQSPTADLDVFTTTVKSLVLGDGADTPEDYTRVLHELGQINNIGWRKGAKKIVILFGDAPTHDLNFAGANFGGDPGPNAVAEENNPGGDDLDFETEVANLAAEQIAVLAIDSGGSGEGDADSAATFKGMSIGFGGAGGTAGQYFVLTDTANLPNAVVQLVQAETQSIDNLTLQVTPGFEGWVTWTPQSMTNVPAETAQVFNVTVTVPAGTAPGYYPIGIQALADGVVLGISTVYVLVPAPAPANDLGFRPIPHGFGQPAYPGVGADKPDWAMFRQLFGSAQVEYANGTHVLAADQYFINQYSVMTDTRFGMGGLSLINFKQLQQDNSGVYEMPQVTNLFTATNSLGTFNLKKPNIAYATGTLHNRENFANAAFFCANFGTPVRWFDFLKSRIQNGNPSVLTIYFVDGGVTQQVSVAPYRIDPAQGIVNVYEPKSTGDAGYRLEFNLPANTVNLVDDNPPPGVNRIIVPWSKIQAVQTAGKCALVVTPLDLFLHKGVPPTWSVPVVSAAAAADEIQMYLVSGDAALLVEDDSGRFFGWNGEAFQNDIPGAVFLGQASTAANGPGEYLLPGGFQYKVWLVGVNTGRATLMTGIGSTFVQVADVAVTPGSKTEIDVALDGSTVSIGGANAPTTATISINHLLSGEDRTATADEVQVQTGQTVQMSYTAQAEPGLEGGLAAAATGLDKFSLASSGGPGAVYNLSLQRRGTAGYTVFGAPDVALEANSSQALSITDWTSLREVALAVDEGRDGTVDNFINAPNVSGPAAISVSAAPASIVVGGGETEVTVAVYDQFGAYAPDGTPVALATTRGALQPATGLTVGGLVTVKLQSGAQAGPAVVTAATGAITGQGTITFVPAAPVSLSAAAAPASLPADGVSTAKIGARVVDGFNNPVAGVKVSFQTSRGSISAAAVTNANGRAVATLTSALEVGTAVVTATSGSLVQTVSVPFAGSAIRGVIFADLNRNGMLDSGEPPLRGARMVAVSKVGNIRGAARSGANGAYQIANLPLTGYTVTAAANSGLRFTTQRSFDVNLGPEGVDMPTIGGAWTLYLPQVKGQ